MLDLWIVSYGGSGSNFLADWLSAKYVCRSPLWERSLCHCLEPLPLSVPTLAIVAHPCAAWRSMERRGLLAVNAAKIGCDVDGLPAAMVEFLRVWRASSAMLVKYESLPATLPRIAERLGAETVPPWNARTSDCSPIERLAEAVELWREWPDLRL